MLDRAAVRTSHAPVELAPFASWNYNQSATVTAIFPCSGIWTEGAMVDMNRVWAGTRTYIVSGRTNPTPAGFIADLRKLHLSAQQKQQLKNQVMGFPGAAAALKQAVIADISAA
jgi:hypothetical protein